MNNLALVASQNGFGHSRRLFYIGCALQELGFPTTLYVGAAQAKNIQTEVGLGGVIPDLQVIKPFDNDGPHIPATNFQIEVSLDSLLDKQSHIISDNVIFNESNSFPYYLHGHFNWLDFWIATSLQEDLPVIPEPSYGELISWFRLENFHMNSEIPESKCHSIPFLRYADLEFTDLPQAENLIWVSKGTTNDFDFTSLQKLVSKFPNLNFVECESFRLRNQQLLPAAVVGRPGLGTIKDCLEAGVPFISLGEALDVELSSNVRNLVRLGLHPEAVNPESALREVLSDPGIRTKYFNYWGNNSISMHEYATLIAKVIS
jgi:hypothetical protein